MVVPTLKGILEWNSHTTGDRERTERLPAAVLNSEVEERIGGGETAFRDERAIEQRLMIDPLNLSRNEPMWIFWWGWYRQQGGAGVLSFG